MAIARLKPRSAVGAAGKKSETTLLTKIIIQNTIIIGMYLRPWGPMMPTARFSVK
jgi:hypothetical protein